MRAQRGRRVSGFNIRVKQLSRVLTGKKYLGGTQAHKCKATDELPAKQKKDN